MTTVHDLCRLSHKILHCTNTIISITYCHVYIPEECLCNFGSFIDERTTIVLQWSRFPVLHKGADLPVHRTIWETCGSLGTISCARGGCSTRVEESTARVNAYLTVGEPWAPHRSLYAR